MPRRQPLPLTIFINRAVNRYPVKARADRLESFLLFHRNASHWRRAVPLPVARRLLLLLPARCIVHYFFASRRAYVCTALSSYDFIFCPVK